MAEQRFCKPQVVGSSPTVGSTPNFPGLRGILPTDNLCQPLLLNG
jgi:hypothetical protein